MRIDPNLSRPDLVTNSKADQAAQSRDPKGGATEAAPPPRGADQAQISFSAERINSLKAQVAALSEVRQGRVEALRSAIAQGSYQVEPQQVAQALLQDQLARR